MIEVQRTGCEPCRDLWSEAYDRELDPARAEQLSSHLHLCEPCREAAASYERDLDEVGRFLARSVDDAYPSRKLRLRAGSVSSPWLKLAAAAALVVLVTSPLRRLGPDYPVANPVVATVASADCPWHETSPDHAPIVVTYPVLADECIEHELELVRASLRSAGTDCPEALRLVYEGPGRRFELEQNRASNAPPCCSGQQVSLGDAVGCLEGDHRTGQSASVRWQQERQEFRLSGDANEDDVLRVAASLSRRFSELD